MAVLARLSLCVVLLLTIACQRRAPTLPLDETAAPEEDTTLGQGDVFEVRVFGHDDLTGKFRVGTDGTIQFPFLGVVHAGGKEPELLARDIAVALREGGYLREPQVTVLVEQTNSKRISVLGAVAKPGTLAMVPGMTVIQAISQAGGFAALADKDGTVVTRRVDGKLERFRVPVSEISRGKQEDFQLRTGDIVFVPERIF